MLVDKTHAPYPLAQCGDGQCGGTELLGLALAIFGLVADRDVELRDLRVGDDDLAHLGPPPLARAASPARVESVTRLCRRAPRLPVLRLLVVRGRAGEGAAKGLDRNEGVAHHGRGL